MGLDGRWRSKMAGAVSVDIQYFVFTVHISVQRARDAVRIFLGKTAGTIIEVTVGICLFPQRAVHTSVRFEKVNWELERARYNPGTRWWKHRNCYLSTQTRVEISKGVVF